MTQTTSEDTKSQDEASDQISDREEEKTDAKEDQNGANETEQVEQYKRTRTFYTNQTPYYRGMNESIGESLYQDALNREKRSQLIAICEKIKSQKR